MVGCKVNSDGCLNWKEHPKVIPSQPRQIGTAESNKEQLMDKPGQNKEKAINVKETNERTGRLLRARNSTRKGK